jgi:hypothetical protein
MRFPEFHVDALSGVSCGVPGELRRSATRRSVALKCYAPASPSREPAGSRLVMVDTAAPATSSYRVGRTATDMLCSDQEAGGSSFTDEQPLQGTGVTCVIFPLAC